MSEKYQVIVTAKLDKIDFQKQLDSAAKEIATATSATMTKKATDLDKLNNQITRWKNTLTELSTKSPIASQSVEVKKQRLEVEKLINAYQNNEASYDDVRTSIDTLNKEYVLAKENIARVTSEMSAQDRAAQNLQKSTLAQADAMSKAEADVKKWQNQRATMGERYPKAFNTEAVQREVQALEALEEGYINGDVAQHQMTLGMSNVRRELEKTRIETAEAAENTGNLGDQFSLAAKKVAIWAVATTAIYGTLRAVKEGIAYVSELDKEMTNIRVVTQLNIEDTHNLSQSYNDLAKELSVTTLEVAQGSTEWLRQGETIENTQELLRSTIMLAKLGNMTTAESTEYLISTLNGFNFEAEKSMDVIDKLINLDNLYATSAAEIAQALQRSSASAQQAGVSFDELVSYITTVSSVTRRSASSIGESFKTMFARMQRVKIGAEFDEAGESISDVEEVLENNGIAIRDNLDSFRPLGDVLDEIASKWGDLTTVQQNQTAEAIAGIRQRENFLVLMQNYNTVLEAQGKAAESAGLAQERYALYLESIEAAANKAATAWEGVWQRSINTDFIKFVYESSASVAELVEDVGGLVPVLTTILGIFIAIKSQKIGQMIAQIGNSFNFTWSAAQSLNEAMVATQAATAGTTVAMQGATAASTAMWASITGGISLIITAVSLLSMAVNSIETLEEKMESISESIAESQNKIKDLGSTLSEFKKLYAEYEQLNVILDKTPGGSEEYVQTQERLFEVQNRLKEIMPGLNGDYDAYGNFIISAANNMDALTEATKKQIAQEKERLQLSREESVGVVLEDLRNAFINLQRASEGFTITEKGIYKELNSLEIFDITQDYEETLRNAEEVFASLGYFTQLEFIEGIEDEGLRQRFIDYQVELRQAAFEAEQDWVASQKDPRWEREPEEPEEIIAEDEIHNVEEVNEQLSEIQDKISSIIESYGETGELTAEQIASVQTLFPEDFINILEESEGKIRLNTEAMYDLAVAQARVNLEAARLTASQDNATDEMLSQYYQAQALYNGLVDLQQEFLETTIVVNSVGREVSLTGSQFESFASDVSSVLFNLSDNSGIVLRDVAGNALQSADQVRTALLTKMITFSQLVSQLGSVTAAELQSVMMYADSLMDYVRSATPYKPVAPTFGGTSGSTSPEKQALEDEIDARERNIEAIQDEIDKLNDRKKALQDQLDDFKDYIDAQKRSLKLAKEEQEFQDKILKKQTSLAKLKTQIALLALDDSDYAQSLRLELEEEAAQLEEEITEDTEERKYQLKLDALDKIQEQFEKNIDAQIRKIDAAIDAHNNEISVLRDVIDIIQDQISEVNDAGNAGQQAYGQQIPQAIDEARAKLLEYGISLEGLTQETIEKVAEQIVALEEVETSWFTVREAAMSYLSALTAAMTAMPTMAGVGGGGGVIRAMVRHEGGLIESHHNGEFAGNVRSNEVFAKLLKGEYVATEAQMDKFMKTILPKISSYEGASSNSEDKSWGDIVFDTTIQIEGNVDKDVMPDLKNVISTTVLELMEKRGIRRNASSFSI